MYIVIIIAIVGISGFLYQKRIRDRDEVQANQEDDSRKEEYFKGMLKEGEILEIITTLSKRSELNDQELGEYCLAEM